MQSCQKERVCGAGFYPLIPKKKGRTYRKLFEVIKELWPNLNPVSILIKFEQATIGSIRTKFLICKILRWLFYLTKKVQKTIRRRFS
ncbi:hypothetical protein MXB_1385 [Myxobolus squamalis]|nr:hypothetical protein MXB_1385 [Myxobolus squamalis]